MKPHKTIYRRRLPHIQPENGVFAITVCIAGSLPKYIIAQLQDERDLLIAQARRAGKSKEEIQHKIKNTREFYFGKFDDLLDNPKSGKMWLTENLIWLKWWLIVFII